MQSNVKCNAIPCQFSISKLLFVNAVKPCERGWTGYNNNCYKHVRDKVKGNTAKSRCRRYGANLASITSAEENNFIADLIKNGGQ